MQKENKILLHSCCAICSGYPILLLKELGYTPIVFFCNPNLDTEEEFNRRLEAQKTLCSHLNTELIVESYNPQEYSKAILGLEMEPERGLRCDKCIELRLLNTFKKAKELGINQITTSLPISPHKNFDRIKELGENLVTEFDIQYIAIDFKKKDGFLKTNNIAKELNLYRQKYCGCKYAK